MTKQPGAIEYLKDKVVFSYEETVLLNSGELIDLMEGYAASKEKIIDTPIVRQVRVNHCLSDMMKCDMELYEKIMDTPGFSYQFSQLTKLALHPEPPIAWERIEKENNL